VAPVKVLPIINTVNECIDHWKSDFSSTLLVFELSYYAVLKTWKEVIDGWSDYIVELSREALVQGEKQQKFRSNIQE